MLPAVLESALEGESMQERPVRAGFDDCRKRDSALG